VWDIATGQCIHTLAGQNRHASAVTSLQYFKGMVVSGGDDGVVKLWDIKRGIFHSYIFLQNNIVLGTFICDLLRFGATGSGCCVWKVKATPTLLVCAVGSRNQTEDTRLVLMDFDAPYP
jgi:F-box/WD-40 domain protein 7